MSYVVTSHKSQQIKERKIQIYWIEKAISSPDKVETDEENADIEHRMIKIPEFGLRVFKGCM